MLTCASSLFCSVSKSSRMTMIAKAAKVNSGINSVKFNIYSFFPGKQFLANQLGFVFIVMLTSI